MSRNAGNNENGEFGDISPNLKIQANELETRQQNGEFDEKLGAIFKGLANTERKELRKFGVI